LAFDDAIGVVVGLAAEARIARRLGWRVAIGGGTAEGAAVAADRLVGSGARALVSFGLAGGLNPALTAGTITIPSAVILDDVSYATDPELAQRLGGATPHVTLAADRLAASTEAKLRLHQATGAAALDLESGAVVRACKARGLPFAVLRAICDPVDRCMPPAALAALDAGGAIDAWRVLVSLVGRPSQFPAVLALAVDAAKARQALVRWVKTLAHSTQHGAVHLCRESGAGRRT
jgi:adenosylhomocysteine nucleosidase